MSNTKSFAERELDILVKSCPDPDNRPIIEEFIPEILALCEKFGQSGQSGGSAPYVAGALSSAISKLLLQKPICPITGIDEEWTDVGRYENKPEGIVFQNNRCYAVFKYPDGCRYLDTIIWDTDKDLSFSGTAWLSKEHYLADDWNGKIGTFNKIKSFPFEPKTFHVDVIEEEVFPGDWEFFVKDPSQLDAVWEYYDRMPIKK